MTSILTEIISILTGGITGMASGIGTGLNSLVTQMFVSGTGTTSDPYALSTFGGLIIVFAGIGLAVGLSRRIFMWLTSLGAN